MDKIRWQIGTSCSIIDEYIENRRKYTLIKFDKHIDYKTHPSDALLFTGLFTNIRINDVLIDIKPDRSIPHKYKESLFSPYQQCCKFSKFDNDGIYMSFNITAICDIAYLLNKDELREAIIYGRSSYRDVFPRLERDFIETLGIKEIDTIDYEAYNILIDGKDVLEFV